MRTLCGLGIAVLVAATGVEAQGTRRTIYITARAADGGAAPVLTPSDIVVKEAGQPRSVTRVESSRTPLQVAVAVEERLAPDDDVRRSVANFFDHVYEAGKVALYVVGRRSERRSDYTSEIVPFARAINGLPPRSTEHGDLVQAVQEIARDQRSREGRRVIVVVGTESAIPSSVTATGVLEQLAAGSCVLYAATIAGSSGSTVPAGSTSGGRRLDLEGQVSAIDRDRMYADGTRQSGGLHVSFQRTAGMFDALERMAGELVRQYVVTYEGDLRGDGSVSVESTRPGVIVRGPTRTR